MTCCTTSRKPISEIRREAIQERQRRGWTGEEYAILNILGREDGLRLHEIAQHSEARGRPITPDAVVRLAARGLVSVLNPADADSEIRLTPTGRQSIIQMIAMLKAGEADALEGFDPSEVQLLKQLLRRVGGG